MVRDRCRVCVWKCEGEGGEEGGRVVERRGGETAGMFTVLKNLINRPPPCWSLITPKACSLSSRT